MTLTRRDPEPPTTYGEHLRAARREAGLNMHQMAQRLGIPITHLSDVERDKAAPLGEELTRRAAELVGCDPQVLLAARDPRTARLELLERYHQAALKLLAVIHRDGGHHVEEVGFLRACANAEAVVVAQRAGVGVQEAGTGGEFF